MKKNFIIQSFRNKNIVSLFVFFVLIRFSLISQNIDFTKENFPGKDEKLNAALKDIKKGDDLMKAGELFYPRALEFYLKANEFNPDNAELNFKIGACYLYSSFKQKALPFLENAKKLNPDVNDHLYYYFGRAYHLNMQWIQAIEFYESYKKRIAGTEDASKGLTEADKKIQECKYGIELMKDTVRFRKIPDSLRYRIENLGPQVNSSDPDYHPLISADESVLIFTSRRSNTTGGGMDPYSGKYFEDIYRSFNEKERWTLAKNLGEPVNTSNRHDATCGLSVDGQKLYIYLDDTYSGSGNIYECSLSGYNWSEPKKLPSAINTRYHESSASLSPDGKIVYFCSENPKDNSGIGSHDIFKSVKNEKGEWGEPENLGPVINTEYDERTVFMHPDGKTLYFSSQGHSSMGGFDVFKSVYNDSLKKWSVPANLGYPVNSPDDDLDFVVSASGKHAYYATIRPDGFGEKDIFRITLPADTTPQLTLVKGNVTDESGNPVGSKIEISDKKTGKHISTQESNSATGKFLVSLPSGKDYEMKVNADGYDPYQADFNIPKGEKYKEVDLTIKLKRKEQFVDIEGDVKDEKGNPLRAKIEIINNATGEVIARTTADKLGEYLSRLKAGKNYGIVVSTDGYLFQSLNIDIPPDKDRIKIPTITLKKIQAGKNIVLNNIFFDFDKASLRSDSKPELMRVKNVLNDNPSMKIEISGHTDNKGSATYNLQLSEERAKSVIDFLVSSGIDKKRLSFKGYGFMKPTATNNTEEGRQLNRRTEFKVLEIDETTVSSSGTTATQTTSASKLPAEFASVDKNNDGRISAFEIVSVIDAFFDGDSNYTVEKIHRVIDFFFEQ